MSLPTPKATADHGLDFGPTPRLRSLRIPEESKDASSTEGLTPSLRHSSLPESDRSPLRLRLGSFDAHLKHANARAESKWTWRQQLPVLVAVLFLLAAAMAFISSRSTSQDRSIAAVESLQGAQQTLEREIGATFNSHRKVAKVDDDDDFASERMGSAEEASGDGTRSQESVTGLFDVFAESDITASTSGEDVTELHTASGTGRLTEEMEETSEIGFSKTSPGEKAKKGSLHAAPKQTEKSTSEHNKAGPVQSNDTATQRSSPEQLTAQHLKVYVAELAPKYNLDIFEAVHALGDLDASPQGRTVEELVKRPLSLSKDSDLLDIPSHHLDVVLHALIMESPLRVTNMSEADIIWVPFWVHKLVRLDQEIEKPNKYDLAQVNFWNEVDRSLPLLGKKPHILVVPGQESELMGSCGGFGIGFLCHRRASQLTIVSPEIYPGKVVGGSKGASHEEGISVAVPDVSNVRLQRSSLASKFDARGVTAMKTKLISEAFRSRAPIRKVLKTQCLGNPKECSHAEPSSRLSSVAFSKAVHENDRTAWFSLQPPGDTTVRLPFYNSLLTESIPVAFDPKLLNMLPFGDHIRWKELLAQVPSESIMSHKKLVADILKANYSMEARLSRLQGIHDVRVLLQYEARPNISSVRFDALGTRTPNDDAFTMSLKTLVQNLCQHNQLPPARCGSTQNFAQKGSKR